MHRFYVPPENCRSEPLRLQGREAHHALHVLRLKRGDRVTVLDGAGNAFHADVENAAQESLTLAVRENKTSPPPPCSITLLVAIPKGKIMEDIVQKAVELGVQRIVPLLAERVVLQFDDDGADAKRAKWRHVAIEAIKQCGATWLPGVEKPQTIPEFLARKEMAELSFVGSLQDPRRHPREWILEYQRQHGRLPRSTAAWIGPEGDFTPAELRSIEAAGAKPITLGDLTLRVETAAIYCLSFLNYELRP